MQYNRFTPLPNFDTSSVFHPKLYLFYNNDDDWACVLGSPNFTHSALTKNEEVAVLFTQEDDDGDGSMLASLMDQLDGYWKNAVQVGDRYVGYREQYLINRQKINTLGDTEELSDKKPTTNAIDCRIRTINWQDYFKEIQIDPYHSFTERLGLLEQAKNFFQEHAHFSNFTLDQRKSIAGTMGITDFDWGWFGSMIGAGVFKNKINNNEPLISAALDAIPATGIISRTHFMDSVSLFREAFPEGRDGIAVLSRLLTMKRPDFFFCIDSRNRRNICNEIGISQVMSGHYERYWDSLLERLMDTPWWQSPQPKESTELKAWQCRMAMLDAIYYETSH